MKNKLVYDEIKGWHVIEISTFQLTIPGLFDEPVELEGFDSDLVVE